MRRVHLFISGRVQGVYFRAHTRDLAQRLGLRGFARNLPDGRVEVVAEGPEEKIEELVQFCHRGPPLAQVTKVEVLWESPTGEFPSFSAL